MDRISAFMDGESAQAETRHAILRLKQSDEDRANWATFHLIGDTLRGDCLLRDDFMARFHLLMEREPTQLAPRMTWRKSANYALSAAAALSAVAVVLTLALSDNPLRPQAQIAVAPKAETTIVARTEVQPRPVAAVDQRQINEYLMAHQEYSPSNAFQGLAPYVRTVADSYDGNGH